FEQVGVFHVEVVRPQLVAPTVGTRSVSVRYPSRQSNVLEIGGAIDSSFVHGLVAPSDHRPSLRQVRVLSVPILAHSLQRLPNRRRCNWERMRLPSSILD